jgi:hypothetical protein
VTVVRRASNSNSSSSNRAQETVTSVKTTTAGPMTLEEVMTELKRLEAMKKASEKKLLMAREAKEAALAELKAMQQELMVERVAKVKLVALNARLDSVLSRGQTALQDIEQLKDRYVAARAREIERKKDAQMQLARRFITNAVTFVVNRFALKLAIVILLSYPTTY